MRAFELVKERQDRIGTAVRLDEIPPKYKHLKLLGRGTTSITYDLDATHVLIFTRDTMKKDWLQNGLKLGDTIDSYESVKHPIKSITDKPIYIMKVEKLFKLSNENKKRVEKLIDEFLTVKNSSRFKSDNGPNRRIIMTYYDILDKHEKEFNSDHDMQQLVDFLSNYDDSQYDFDLHNKNFMQTGDGKLVILDPVIDKEIIGPILYHKGLRNR